jgi:hypothetical protein
MGKTPRHAIDVRNLSGMANRDAVLTSVFGQLTLADTVKLDSAKASFLRSIPITILVATSGSASYTHDQGVLAPATPVPLLYSLARA